MFLHVISPDTHRVIYHLSKVLTLDSTTQVVYCHNFRDIVQSEHLRQFAGGASWVEGDG